MATANYSEKSLGLPITRPQNLECNSITIGGVADHVHVLCNLTKKFPTAKVFGNSQEGFVQIYKDLGRARFSLAGWLRTFQCKLVTFRSGEEIHSRPRRASQKGDVPAGISADSEKNTDRRTMNDICGIESFGMPCQGRSPLQ